jgi:nucleoid DNA-binding protein
MNIEKLQAELRRRHGFTEEHSRQVIRDVIHLVAESLRRGERVYLRHLGVFSLTQFKGCKCPANRRIGEPEPDVSLFVPPHTRIKFSPTPTLRRAVRRVSVVACTPASG